MSPLCFIMVYNVPNFIKAQSAQGLRDAMLSLLQRNAYKLKFFDIQFVQGHWYAWYYEEVKEPQGVLRVGS